MIAIISWFRWISGMFTAMFRASNVSSIKTDKVSRKSGVLP